MKSSELTDPEHDKKIEQLFNHLIAFGKDVQNQDSDVTLLTKICELYEFKRKNQLDHNILVTNTSKIAKLIIKYIPELETNLRKYWNTWSLIFKKIKSEPINIREKTNEYFQNIREIDSVRKEITNRGMINDNAVFYAMFYLHILTIEKIEYAFKSDIENHDMNEDFAEMFSITSKVSKNNKYVTDGRVIRDALAHKKFKIESTGEKRIIFNNKCKGYDFQKTFTIEEFQKYLETHYTLYQMMFVLQSLIILYILLHESIDRVN